MTTPSHEFSLPFLRKEQVAKDTYSFYFEKTESLEYTPGHHIRMTLDLSQEDPRGFRRPFTLCSSPLDKEIMITTKVIAQPSIFKQKLSSLVPGERVKFFGPIGGFLLPDSSEKPLVFLAGGIGITPFHSMLMYAAETKYARPTTLFVSFSTVEEAAFYNVLKTVHQKNSALSVVYTITRPEESTAMWDGETGRITPELISKYISDFQNANYMICGPQVMVDAMVEIVKKMGVPEEQVKVENFPGY